MASRIKGITVEIGGDTTPLQKALKDVDASLSNTQKQLKDVNKLLKLDPNNIDLLKQRQELLGNAVKDTKEKLDTEVEALRQLKAGEQTPEVIEQQKSLEREIAQTSATLQSYKEDLAQASPMLTQLGNVSADVAEKTKKISAAAAGVGVALLGNAYNAALAADDLNTLAKQTGFTTDELQKMQYASDLIDVSVDAMTGSMKKLTSNMSSGAEVFGTLGVAIYDSEGNMRNATDVWYDSLEALSQVENETERDALSMQLFGKSAADLSGIIDDGGAALKDLGQEAEDLGLVLDQDALDAANEFNDAMDKMKARTSAALLKVGNALAKTLVPAIEKVLEFVTKMVEWFTKLDGSTQKTILIIAGLVAAISPVAKVISVATNAIKAIKVAMVAFNPTVLIVVAAIGALIAIGVALYKNWDTVKAKLEQFKNAMLTTWNNIKTAVTTAIESVRVAISTKIDQAKAAVETAVNSIKNFLSFQNLANTVGTVFNTIKTNISNKIEEAKNFVDETVKKIVGFFDISGSSWKLPDISEVVNGVKDTAKGIIDKIVGFFDLSGNGWKLPSISDVLEGVKNTAKGVIDKITGLFDLSGKDWSLPKIKLPHFKVTGGFGWSWNGGVTLPKVEVDWYKRAYDNPVIFSDPTVLATPNGYKGFGDGNGAEIVMGMNKLKELVAANSGITVNMTVNGNGLDANQLSDIVISKLTTTIQRNNQRW